MVSKDNSWYTGADETRGRFTAYGSSTSVMPGLRGFGDSGALNASSFGGHRNSHSLAKLIARLEAHRVATAIF